MLNAEISAKLSRSYNSTKTQKHNEKTLFLIAVLFLTTSISHAQTEKGSQTLGLNLGFTYNKGSASLTGPNTGGIYKGTNQTTSLNIGPAYSYFKQTGVFFLIP